MEINNGSGEILAKRCSRNVTYDDISACMPYQNARNACKGPSTGDKEINSNECRRHVGDVPHNAPITSAHNTSMA